MDRWQGVTEYKLVVLAINARYAIVQLGQH